MHNLTKLNDGVVPTTTRFLKKTSDILAKIAALKSRNTARTYLIAVVTAVKDEPKLYGVYYPELVKINAELKLQNTKSPKQNENWVAWADILALQQAFVPPTRKVWKKPDIDSYLAHVILSLYTLIPPRRSADFALMKCNVAGGIDFNYYQPKGTFIFNNYKTKGTYQQVVEEVPPELQAILKVWIKHKPKSEFLLVDSDQKPFNSVKLGRALNRIFGKKISVSMLRNIYLTDKFAEPMKALADATAAMGTSTGTAMNHYIKAE